MSSIPIVGSLFGPDLAAVQKAEQKRLEEERRVQEEEERRALREEQDRLLRGAGRGARGGQGTRLSDTTATLG